VVRRLLSPRLPRAVSDGSSVPASHPAIRRSVLCGNSSSLTAVRLSSSPRPRPAPGQRSRPIGSFYCRPAHLLSVQLYRAMERTRTHSLGGAAVAALQLPLFRDERRNVLRRGRRAVNNGGRSVRRTCDARTKFMVLASVEKKAR